MIFGSKVSISGEDVANSFFVNSSLGMGRFLHTHIFGFQVMWQRNDFLRILQESCRLRMDGPVVNSESEVSIT